MATVAVVINNNDHHPVTVQILLHVLVKTAGCTRVLKFSQLFGKGVGGLAWLNKSVVEPSLWHRPSVLNCKDFPSTRESSKAKKLNNAVSKGCLRHVGQ